MADNDIKTEESLLGLGKVRLKEARFIAALPNSQTVAEAGIKAGYAHPYVTSYRVLARLKHSPEFIGILAKAKLLPFPILKRIRRGMDAKSGVYYEGKKVASEPNWQSRAKFTELAADITNLKPDKKQTSLEQGLDLVGVLNEAVRVALQGKAVEAEYSVEQPIYVSSKPEIVQPEPSNRAVSALDQDKSSGDSQV